jgi:hypothetical protein
MTNRAIGGSEISDKIEKGSGFRDGDAGEEIQHKLDGVEKEGW